MSAVPRNRGQGLQLTVQQLAAATGCTASGAAVWLPYMLASMARHGIVTPRRAAHFLAQIGHESGGLARVVENLNYTATRLLQVFPRYFSADTAKHYAGMPQRIGNRVYANRMGNGPESSGDGYRYRGRSPIQLTGRNNYASMQALLRLPLLDDPDLAARLDYGSEIACAWWDSNGLNTLADSGDVLAVSRRVNLGTTRTSRTPNGYSDRVARTRRALAALQTT